MKTTMFKDDMLKAVIDLRKTQTRRIIKPQPRLLKPEFEGQPITFANPDYIKKGHKEYCHPAIDIGSFIFRYSRYQIGDIVGIRENFSIGWYDGRNHVVNGGYLPSRELFWHKRLTDKEWEKFIKWKNMVGDKSKLFMFDSLIRNKIEITGIRIEMVQDISYHDAIAEGIYRESDASGYQWYKNYAFKSFPAQNAMFKGDPIESFETLWDLINKKRGYGWEQNNYVFVYEFKVIKK